MLWTDRSAFESELDGLIDGVVRSSSESSPALKRPAAQNTRTKRFKSNHDTDRTQASVDYGRHVHPSRKELLERPDAPELREVISRVEYNLGCSTVAPRSSLVHRKSNVADSSWSLNDHLHQTGTWSTLANTVRRQWNTRKDDLEYQFLLEQRRNENLQKVDRYVPESPTGDWRRRPKPCSAFLFERLPENVRDEIFRKVLVSSDCIQIDFSWLRSFVKGHARIPNVKQKIEHKGSAYVLPHAWNKLLTDIQSMQEDMVQFRGALETRDLKTRATRSPCRGLSTALFRVSRSVNESAVRVFYGQNTFQFPCATSAWVQLESFLATVGLENTKNIKRIRIHAPLWHRGPQEDFVEGAIVDLLSPASRLALIQPPAHDRLLSAIQHSAHALTNADSLISLSLDLENGMIADYWSGRYVNEKRLINMSEAEEYVERKTKGIAALKALSDQLVSKHNHSPFMTLHHASSTITPDLKEFRQRLASLDMEAEKYGWRIDPHLKVTRWDKKA